MTVTGTGFVTGAIVNWNGTTRVTTFVNSTQITAAILAADVAAGGTANVTVTNPTPGGGTSTPATTFTITGTPTIGTLSPPVAVFGTGDFTLTVNGTNFVNGATLTWNGTDRVTTFVSATQLTAAILAADIAAVGTGNLTVRNPAPGGLESIITGYAIVTPTFAVLDLTPRSVQAPGGDVAINVSGTNFTNTSVVRVNGVDQTTAFVNSTLLTATVPAADTAAAGTVTITVFDATPGLSNTETFFVLTPTQEFVYDGFSRANGSIGNNWEEKSPTVDVWTIGTYAVTAPAGVLTYHDKMVTRPLTEDRRDVEVSMEFTRRATSTEGNFAQLHARAQRDTLTNENTLESYIFFVDDFFDEEGGVGPGQAIIAVQEPVQGQVECYIIAIPFTRALVVNNRYRMRFTVSGAGSVTLIGSIDELDASGDWTPFVTGQTTHTVGMETDLFCAGTTTVPAPVPAPIDNAGAVGFSKWRGTSEVLDNFYWISPP